VVRVLAAVVLLGVALLIVALVNQTAASADSLPTPPGDQGNGGVLSRSPAAGPGSAISKDPMPPASAGAYADYVRSLARGAVVTAELPPSAAAGIQLAQLAGTRQQDPGGSRTPWPDAAHTQAPRLGEAVRWGTPGVAQPPKSISDGTGDSLLDGLPSAPGQRAGTMTVAAAQAPSSPAPSRAPGWVYDSIYWITIAPWQDAQELSRHMFIQQTSKELNSMKPEVDKLVASTIANARAARELANATHLLDRAGALIAEASPETLEKVTGATRDVRAIVKLSQQMADRMDAGATALRAEADAAPQIADTADQQVAAALQPDAGATMTVRAIVDPVAEKALSLNNATLAAAQLIQNAYEANWAKADSRSLAKAVDNHATNAKWLEDWTWRDQAVEAATAAASSLRGQAKFSQQVAGWLQDDIKSLREHTQRVTRHADEVDAAVARGGPQPAPPPPAQPPQPGEQGGELVPEPSPAAPVTQQAGVDQKESDPTGTVAVVAGGNVVVQEGHERGGDGADTAGEQPVGVLDASSDPLPFDNSFDNSNLFADVSAESTTFANTS